MKRTPLACQQHNHQRCIDDALRAARTLCRERGVRLTPLREQVLALIWQSHQPLGAYALMEMLARETTRTVAPPTVYRTLEFLQQQQLIHRIHRLNAFVGCPQPGRQHQGHFLICRGCNIAVECATPTLKAELNAVAAAAGFAVDEQAVELLGLCPRCGVHA